LRLADKSIDDSLKQYLIGDFRIADITDLEKAMLTFAEKITVSPASIREDDVATLRRNGLDDKVIHDLVQVAAYYAYVNRLADALGVELEEGWE